MIFLERGYYNLSMIEDRALTLRDLADFLRLEVTDLTPKREANNREFVIKVKQVIERKYGKYFDRDTLNVVRGLEDRVVSFAPGIYSEYNRFFEPEFREDIKDSGAFHSSEEEGDFIGLASRKRCMALPRAEEIVASISENFGFSRRESIRTFRSLVFGHNVIHEMVHAYQTEGFPVFFSECAAPYYVYELQNEMRIQAFIWNQNVPKIDFYTSLVEEFGEDIHGLFFGLKKSRKLKNEVLSTFSDEVLEDLFPTGYSGNKEDLRKVW